MLHELRKTPLIKSRERCRTSRSPALPATLAHRSLTSLCENLVKISAKVVRQAATSFYRRLRSSCRRPVPAPDRAAGLRGCSGGRRKMASPTGGPRVRIHLPPADSLSLSRSRFRRSRSRLSARVWVAGLATGSAETRRGFRYRVNRGQYLCRATFQYRGAAGSWRQA
jgi:hypothetical protein